MRPSALKQALGNQVSGPRMGCGLQSGLAPAPVSGPHPGRDPVHAKCCRPSEPNPGETRANARWEEGSLWCRSTSTFSVALPLFPGL